MSAVSVDTAVELLAMERPAATVDTTMVPMDIIIDRVVGDFHTLISSAAGRWNLGLLVADRGWDIGVSFAADSDKRILWHQEFNATGSLTEWNNPSGLVQSTPVATLDFFECPRELRHIDISPRVRVKMNQALLLCAWEESGTGLLTTDTTDMRILYHQAQRR